jgi:hypothetical protein
MPACGAAGVEDVVDEDDRVVLEPEREVGGVDLGVGAADGEVVAVERDVDVLDRLASAEDGLCAGPERPAVCRVHDPLPRLFRYESRSRRNASTFRP